MLDRSDLFDQNVRYTGSYSISVAYLLWSTTKQGVFGFITAPLAYDPGFTAPLSVRDLFALAEKWTWPTSVALIFAESLDPRGVGEDFFALIGKLIQGSAWPIPLPPSLRTVPGAVIWLSTLKPEPPLGEIPALQLQWTDGPGWTYGNANPDPICTAGGTSLILQADKPAVCPMEIAEDGTLSFGPGTLGATSVEAALRYRGESEPTAVLALVKVKISTDGILTLTGGTDTGLSGLPVGLGLPVTTASTASGPPPAAPLTLVYPLLDRSAGLASADVTATLWPAHAAPSLRFSLPDADLVTCYRTTLGHPIRLRPVDGDSYLEQVATVDDTFLLSPRGSFRIASEKLPDDSELLCGLSGLESIEIVADTQLSFEGTGDAITLMPGANPKAALAPSLSQIEHFTGTTYMRLRPGNNQAYFVESKQVPFYTEIKDPPANTNAFQLFRVSAGRFSKETELIPLMPYAGVAPSGSEQAALVRLYQAVETNCLSAQRCTELLKELEGQKRLRGDATAITPQKFVGEFKDDMLNSIAFAQTPTGQKIGFSVPLKDASLGGLLTAQPFFVITAPQRATVLTEQITMADWVFNLHPKQANPDKPMQTILLVKAAGSTLSQLVANPSAWTDYKLWNDPKVDPLGVEMSAYLVNYFETSRRTAASGVQGLENFLSIIDDPDWSGILYLSPPISTTNPVVQVLLCGVDRTNLYAHHLGVSSTVLGDGPEYKQTSAFFGLIHYVRPGTNPATTPTASPGYVPDNLTYDLQTLTIHAAFANSKMTSFQSLAWLVINQVLGEEVNGSATNAIPLEGAAQLDSSTSPETLVYTLTMPRNYVGTFNISGNVLASMMVNGLSAVLAPKNTLLFTLGGFLSLRESKTADVLSYSALAFANLQIQMVYDPDGRQPSRFTEIDSGVQIKALQQAVGAPEPDSLPTTNLYRKGSLAAQMPVTVNSLVVGSASTLPVGMGFQSVVCEPDTGGSGFAPGKDAPWYGLLLDVDLGGDTGSGSHALLAAQLLYAWTPAASGSRGFAVFFRLLGPGGASLSLTIANVITLGARAVTLSMTGPEGKDKDQFLLTLRSLGLTILGKTFPQQGTTNLWLAGFDGGADGRAMGWFGGYKNKNELS